MSPEKQRIAIAEACGKGTTSFRFWRKGYSDTEWKESPHYPTKDEAEYWQLKESHWGEVNPVEPVRSHENTPNYLTDLNAMAEAKRGLLVTDAQLQDFAEWLGYDEAVFPIKNLRCLLLTTPDQEAKALLRTLGKWES